MQQYQDIPDTKTLTESRLLLLNNILTAMSRSSGTAFPTTNLVLGMSCYRADLNKTYALTNLAGPVWTLEQDYSRTPAYLDDNVTSATKLQTARTIALSGDVSGNASFDGTANASIAATLSNTGVTAGTYTSVTVDAKGRVTGGTSPTAVNSFNSRTGAVTLSSTDIATALGYTPMNAANASFGSLTVSSTANYIALTDTDWGTRHIHHNGGTVGFLDSTGAWGWYTDNNGNVWTKAYGWLHGAFFSSVSNCGTVSANCGNLSLTNTASGGYALYDDGASIRLNGNIAINCNCNCACDANCGG